MSRHPTTTALLSLLVLLPDAARGRQWNLPTPRVVTPGLMRHDFSTSNLGQDPFRFLPTVVALSGGETKSSEDEDELQRPHVPPATAAVISRGGSTTTRRQLEAVSEENQLYVSLSHINVGNPRNVTEGLAGNQMEVKPVVPKPKLKLHKRIAQKLKNRNATNLRRKLMHASFGMGFALLNHFIPKHTFVPAMAVLSSATLLMELLRYREGFGWMNQALHFVLGTALRKHEMDGKFTGSFYFFTGVTVTAALFPTSAATMGIIQLAIADPSASYFGRATQNIHWSRIQNGLGGIGRNKGFLGFVGGALCCVPFNYRILSIAKFGAKGVPGGRTSLAIASLALGAAGAFADLAVPTPALTMPKKIWGAKVPPFHLDDNFVVPIVSGFACTQAFKALGWQQNLQLAKFLFV